MSKDPERLVVSASPELDPLFSVRLAQRLPCLPIAMNRDVMRAHLESALFDGTGLVVETCELPKAQLIDRACRLHYLLRARTPCGQPRVVLVIATMFPDPRMAIEFEQTTLIPLAEGWHPSEVPTPRGTGVLAPLGMALSVFPVSDQLPTLTEVTDQPRMTELFRVVFRDRRAVEVTGIELVRFTRTPRCALRYNVTAGGDTANVYGKVAVIPNPAELVTALSALGSDKTSRACDCGVNVPRLVAHSPELELMLFEEVAGSRPRIGVDAPVGAVLDAAARAAAWVHGSGLPAGPTRTFEAEVTTARTAAESLRPDAPELSARLTAVIDSLDTLAGTTPTQPLTFAHGDFTPSQLLLHKSAVGLVDFDDLCQAEPALDLGRFLAYVRVAIARAGLRAEDALASRLVESYRAVGGSPTPETRAELYAALSVVSMIVHSWRRIKATRLQVAYTVLEDQLARLIS